MKNKHLKEYNNTFRIDRELAEEIFQKYTSTLKKRKGDIVIEEKVQVLN